MTPLNQLLLMAELLRAKGTNIAPDSAQIKVAASANMPVIQTDKGGLATNLDDYFSNEPNSDGFLSLGELPPIFLPSGENIQALTEHVSSRFSQMLDDYNIPVAPDKITYDAQGKIQIPLSYPYAAELKQALDENPGIKRELSTINALSSHYVEMQRRVPFTEEMNGASSKMAVERIIKKYSHLLNDNYSYSSLALHFSKEGAVSVKADGVSVAFS